MLFPVRQLIEGRDKPVCVPRTASIREALALMIKHDFSQLPVLSASGKLMGLVSEQSIMRPLLHTGGNVQLMPASVDNCLDDAKRIGPDSDIFEALDLLKNVFAVVVVENEEPHMPMAEAADCDSHRCSSLTKSLSQ